MFSQILKAFCSLSDDDGDSDSDDDDDDDNDEDDDDNDAGTSRLSKTSDSRSLPDEQRRHYLDKRVYRYMSKKYLEQGFLSI